MAAFSSNQTSARFLISILERRAGDAGDGDAQARYELGFDVFIKARSYAILNKVFFWLAVVTALWVFLWPAVLVLAREALHLDLVASAITQTMITALGSFFVFVYSHYKARQTAAENLLRAIVFEKGDLTDLVEAVMAELAKIDKGISFKMKSGGES